jgi:hypothetical protein
LTRVRKEEEVASFLGGGRERFSEQSSIEKVDVIASKLPGS